MKGALKWWNLKSLFAGSFKSWLIFFLASISSRVGAAVYFLDKIMKSQNKLDIFPSRI